MAVSRSLNIKKESIKNRLALAVSVFLLLILVGCTHLENGLAAGPSVSSDQGDLVSNKAAPIGVDLSGGIAQPSREGLTGPLRINLTEAAGELDQLPAPICPTMRRHRPSSKIQPQERKIEDLDDCPGAPISLASTCDFQPLPPPTLQQGGAPALEGSFNPPGLNSEVGTVVCQPPDASIAVGPDHLLIVVNSVVQVYDRRGNADPSGPMALSDFFSGMVDCQPDLFDPKVLYDENEGRFFLGADGNGGHYCFAASDFNNPLSWCKYSFDAIQGSGFFDFPQAGVGAEHIFIGANVFLTGGGVRGQVWSLRKDDMYSCNSSVQLHTKTLGSGTTPQPVNIHRAADNSWPSGPHTFLTNHGGFSDGSIVGVWKWSGGTSMPTLAGQVDLDHFTQVKAALPSATPQQNGSGDIQATDWRVLDAEFRSGMAWFVQSISCNTVAGPKNAIRWGKIDTNLAQINQAGVLWSPFQHMIVPDLAVNKCQDMTLGYTKSDGVSPPSVHFTNRLGGDPPNTLRDEICCKTGELDYSCSNVMDLPYRWGDYTGATSDPDGIGSWYLGEYSNDSRSPDGNWGFAVCKISTGCVDPTFIFADGFESGDTSAWASAFP